MSARLTMVLLLVATGLTACGGGNGKNPPALAPVIVSFSAADPDISTGETTALLAEFRNGNGSIDNGVGAVSSGAPVNVSPASDIIYTLTVTNSDGVLVTQQIEVRVHTPPSISGFSAADNPITSGQATMLTADFADGTATIDNGVGDVDSGVPVSVSPTVSTTYTLTVTNQAGTTVTDQVDVDVVPPPAISSFTADDPAIATGQSTSLTAVFSNGVGSIDNGIGIVTSGSPVPISPGATTTYTLTVVNAAGTAATQTLTVRVTGLFRPTTETLTTGRSYHTATRLANGKVLLAGGFNPVTSSAELYDPATDTFSATGSMTAIRFQHAATLLPDGRVLVTGGIGTYFSAELYDPATGAFSLTDSMSVGRSKHTATLLQNGRVLVGGDDSGELYDPATETFSGGGSLAFARADHAATLLADGRVLITGGQLGGPITAEAELYDPATNSFSLTGSLVTARHSHAASALPDGRVLITGGYNDAVPGGYLDSAEIYDPTTGIFTSVGSMSTPRDIHTSTTLFNGKVLIAGGIGEDNTTFLSSAELFDPATDTFAATDDMEVARYSHSATILDNGKVLIAGGNDGVTTGLASAELYVPADLIEVSWADISTSGDFERQAVTFNAIQVSSFVSFETSGFWQNLVDTTNSQTRAQIYLNINGQWVLFAENDSVRGTAGSTFALDGFVFFDVDFSAGPLTGINFTTNAAGATSYRSMLPNTTLTFGIGE